MPHSSTDTEMSLVSVLLYCTNTFTEAPLERIPIRSRYWYYRYRDINVLKFRRNIKDNLLHGYHVWNLYLNGYLVASTDQLVKRVRSDFHLLLEADGHHGSLEKT